MSFIDELLESSPNDVWDEGQNDGEEKVDPCHDDEEDTQPPDKEQSLEDSVEESILFAKSSESTQTASGPETEYDDTLTVYYLLQKLETLETQMQEFNNRLTKMEDSAPSKKRSLPNESEVVIHQCITRFLTNWKRHFRCIHHYRNDCKYPALKCARIHDNTHDSDLSKEIRSLLLHSESAYLRNLIRQNKMGAARPACISMCEDLKATKSMYLAHLSKA
jgi:hypothetical protein